MIGLLGEAIIKSVRAVSSGVERNEILPGTITIIVMDWHSWSVNRKLLKVWSSMAIELGVEVRKYATLKKWILCKVYPTNNVAWLELFITLVILKRGKQYLEYC